MENYMNSIYLVLCITFRKHEDKYLQGIVMLDSFSKILKIYVIVVEIRTEQLPIHIEKSEQTNM